MVLNLFIPVLIATGLFNIIYLDSKIILSSNNASSLCIYYALYRWEKRAWLSYLLLIINR